MQITVTGKQIDVGDAFRQHAQTNLSTTVEKYFGTAIEAHAVIAREAYLIRSDISVRVGRGILVQGTAEAEDVYVAFDKALEHIAKRMRRHKRRLRDHHAKGRDKSEAPVLSAPTYVLAAPAEEPEGADEFGHRDGDHQPMVIAEMTTDIPSLTVGEAVMRLDLADAQTFMFRNSAHGGLNVVYRRPDGHIGWIDPRLDTSLGSDGTR
jgi:ribosomal subunit interface protein